MKRFIKPLVIGIVVLVMLIPGVLLAQDEGITLEGLAKQVTSLAGRVERLERLYMPPPITDKDGNCQLAAEGAMHPSTQAAYQAIAKNQVPIHVQVKSIFIVPGEGIAIELETFHQELEDAHVTEYWSGCEFQSHSRFWAEDYRGNKIWIEGLE